MNRAILIGNLTDNPKTAVTASGIAKCTFRLATQRRYVDQQTGKREADFHNVVVWRGLAELCAKYLTKGRRVSVEGTIQYRSYMGQDGSKRYVTEIVAENMEFLSPKPQGQEDEPAPAPDEMEYDDGDLPF